MVFWRYSLPEAVPTADPRTPPFGFAGPRRALRSTVRRTAPAAIATPTPDSPPVISVVIIDDNRLLLDALTAMIRTQPEFSVLLASTNVDDALTRLRQSTPDIVLLDIGLEEYDSLNLTETVRKGIPSARVVVMGLLTGQDDVAEYVRVGASGFVMKESSAEDLYATIRSVATGTAVLPPVLAHTLFSQIQEDPTLRSEARRLEAMGLTVRERQVVELLTRGLSNKEIATRMNIAVHTVKSHVHNVLEKLTLRSRLEVVAFSHKHVTSPDATDPEL